MDILALDSSSGGCAVCVWRDGEVLAQAQEFMERGQDSRLVPMVQEVLHESGSSFAALDRIAVTRGPGSFTGLRIGLATARGLGLAAEKPVIGIDRFAIARAQQRSHTGDLLVILESRRAELFVQHFPPVGEVDGPQMLLPDEIEALLVAKPAIAVTGDGVGSMEGRLAGAPVLSLTELEAVTCAALAAKADPADPHYLPRPLYLRAPDVTIQAGGGVL